MEKDPDAQIEVAVTEADNIIRERLEGIKVDHLILTIGPGETAVIRSNCGPNLLRHMADVLRELADEYMSSAGERERH